MKKIALSLAAVGAIGYTQAAQAVPRPIPFEELCFVDAAFNATFGPITARAWAQGYPTLSMPIYQMDSAGAPQLTGFAVATWAATTISVSFTSSGKFSSDPLYNAMYFTALNVTNPPPGGDDPYGGLTITGLDPQTNMAGFTAENLFHPVISLSPGIPDIQLAGLSYDPTSRIVLDVALVPEPATAAILGTGVGMLLLWRSRRRWRLPRRAHAQRAPESL